MSDENLEAFNRWKLRNLRELEQIDDPGLAAWNGWNARWHYESADRNTEPPETPSSPPSDIKAAVRKLMETDLACVTGQDDISTGIRLGIKRSIQLVKDVDSGTLTSGGVTC